MDAQEPPEPRPRPPPRSASIRSNICKLLNTKGSRSSYVLNPNPKSRWSCSSLSTSSSSPFDGHTNCSLTRLSEEVIEETNASSSTSDLPQNTPQNKGVTVQKKKLWIKSWTSLASSHIFSSSNAIKNSTQANSSNNTPDDTRSFRDLVKLRPKSDVKHRRPKSEALPDDFNRPKGENLQRYSTVEGNLRFGQLEAYVRLDPLGEGSYATVFKGYSK